MFSLRENNVFPQGKECFLSGKRIYSPVTDTTKASLGTLGDLSIIIA